MFGRDGQTALDQLPHIWYNSLTCRTVYILQPWFILLRVIVFMAAISVVNIMYSLFFSIFNAAGQRALYFNTEIVRKIFINGVFSNLLATLCIGIIFMYEKNGIPAFVISLIMMSAITMIPHSAPSLAILHFKE